MWRGTLRMMTGEKKMARCEVKTYDVGQGLFSLLWEEKEDGIFCALFDCGTSKWDPEISKEDIIDDAVSLIQACGGLDMIVISHQDSDHQNYLWELMRQVYGEIPYMGAGWKKNSMYPTRAMNIGFGIVEWCECGNIRSYIKWFATDTQISYYFSEYSCYEVFFLIDKYYIQMKICENSSEQEIELLIQETNGEEISVKDTCGTSVDVLEIIDKIFEYDQIPPIIGQRAKNRTRYYMKQIYEFSEEKIVGIIEAAEMLELSFQKEIRIIMGGAECGSGYKMLKKKMSFFGEVLEYENALINMPAAGMTEPSALGIDENVAPHSALWATAAIRKNATSVVSCYQTRENQILLFPGDTTVHVFKSINEAMTEQPINLMIAPHHGAFHTNYVVDKDMHLVDAQPISVLLNEKTPQCVFISAFHSKHGHPSGQFINDVCETAAEAPEHLISYCINLNRGCDQYGWAELPCSKAVYTTETSGHLIWPVEDVEEEKMIENSMRRTQEKLPPDGCFVSRERVNV